ncbi:hypothetical protein HPB50_007720 [Hyalomma asiaticum]|uniref:Uncharacterized protein n=1 Tax=Hyalomma asiaticum TaxID=266040 RepID=A0ACB7S512_HYAAI|nr:hypothetical protein HPB50_007720 [Hyalomma asiaticum]
MHGMYCAISGCCRCANTDVGISFQSIPRNHGRKKQWDDAFGVTSPPGGRVSSDLFRAFDYLPFSYSKERLRDRLKSTAVPSLSSATLARCDAQSTTYCLDRGVPQGSILGTLLFNVSMLTVAEELESNTGARYTIYADDITIWTEAQDYGGNIQDMASELQAALLTLEGTLPKLGLTLAPEKTQLLCVNGRVSTLPPEQAITLTLGTHEIKATHGYIRILGIPFHSCRTGNLWPTELKRQWPNY